jgi:hypothetical protein
VTLKKRPCSLEQRRAHIAAYVMLNRIADGGMRFTFPP